MIDKAHNKNKYNTDKYKKKLDKSYSDELSFFNEFYQTINGIAKKNQQISLNNLKESKLALENLREKANKITESIINHDEHMIVEKQKKIRNSLTSIHNNNYKIYNYEKENLNKNVFSTEKFFDNIIKFNQEFFESYKYFLSSSIYEIDSIYNFLEEKNESFNYVLNKHFSEIQEEFANLDDKISKIDKEIESLMLAKKQKETILDEFFNVEIKNLIENQINFSINQDPYSSEISSITETRIYQFNQFKKHILKQENRLETKLANETKNVFQEHYSYIFNKTNNNKKAVKYANKKTNDLVKENLAILYNFKKENINKLFQLKKYLNLYLNLYKVDPFLGQLFVDNLSKFISDEVGFTRLYKMNKSQKYNLYYTYKLAELNQKIKLMEFNLIHFIKKKFIEQEIDITNIIFDINSYLLDNKDNIDTTRIVLKRDHLYLNYLDKLFEVHQQNLIDNDKIDRTFLYDFSEYLNEYIREKENLDIKLISATSDIKLALKESSIESLHFRNLYENEKRYLLIQQNRLKSETDINYEFILTTYENQMRFAKEQIKLADEELKLRLNSIIETINSERDHFYKLIDEEVKEKEKAADSKFATYQKNVYNLIDKLETSDSKVSKNKTQKQLDKLRKEYRKEIDIIIEKYIENKKINLYNKRLQELDMYLEDAFLNASKLYDETFREMDEIYRFAEDKYNEIIETVDKESYPLDEFLYNSLQDMKDRLNYRIKYTEIALYEKIHDKLEAFKSIYFENQIQFKTNKIMNLLNGYQEEKNNLKETYNTKLEDTNNNHLIQIEEYNQEIFDHQLEHKNIKQEIINKKKSLINKKTSERNKKDHNFKDFLLTIKNNHKEDLENLIINYYHQTEDNKTFNKQLKNNYQKLLDNYKNYINYSKKSKNIRKLIKKTLKETRKEKSKATKKLNKEKANFKLL
ncbi:MAG: hypothetical protein ACQERX_00900 [Bacillota bacterium]